MPEQLKIGMKFDNAEDFASIVGPLANVVGLDFLNAMRNRQIRLEEIAIEMFGLAAGEEIVIGGGIHKRI